MHRKILFSLVIALLASGTVFAQNATIKGKVTENDGKTPIEFATVRLMQEGTLIVGTTTDEEGQYTLRPVPSGKFDLMVTFTGYATYTLEGLSISGSLTRIYDVKLSSTATQLTGVKVTAEKPLFEPSAQGSQQAVDADEMKNMAGKSLSDVMSTMAGVTMNSSGSMNVRGARDGETVYYVDGVQTSSVPQGAIGSMAMLMGALPARYGNATSVMEIETKGPSQRHNGNIDLYGHVEGFNNFGGRFDFTGPLKKKNADASGVAIGYLISGEGSYNTGSAVRGGVTAASQETINYLTENPLSSIGSGGEVLYNLNHVTAYKEGEILSLPEKKLRRLQNSQSYGGTLAGKIDLRSKNIDLMVSGNFSYSAGRSFSFSNMLFNSANNPFSKSLSWNVNARFTQRIGNPDKKDAKIQNAFYRLQAYYTQSQSQSYSHVHKDNLFDYGYIGKFEHTMSNYYVSDSIETPNDGMQYLRVLQSFYSSGITFTPSDKNPAMTQYTIGAFDRAGGFLAGDENIQQYKGLLNGDAPESAAYGLFTAPGVIYNGNSKSASDRLGAFAMVSFDIKGKEGRDHSVEFGFEFTQTTSRSHSISPRSLWTIMRDNVNSHIGEMDVENPIFYYDEFGNLLDSVDYKRFVNEANQSTFDRNLRAKLGAAADEWIDVDAYDPETYSLDMFSADELFRSGNNAVVSYYGYDYTGGKRVNSAITMDQMKQWFDYTDPNKEADYSVIGASKPIRMAAYIQDRFAIKNLYFSLGLRLDIFDNNQPYVKDMFLYREAYTVKEAQAVNGLISSETYIPDFMSGSDDYIVYVQEVEASDVQITAFRRDNTWYDAQGNEVTDPATLAQAAGQTNLLPLLKEEPGASDPTKVSYKAFQDYTPTFSNGGISLAPRVSFSFMVGENSLFSASYNISTVSKQQRLNPISYLYFERFAGLNSTFANPGLSPERSIDYEIGFKQSITRDMALEFRAYYSEKRDQIVIYHYNQAYPASYYSYRNMDFGTVQGFMLGLQMRRVKNISFRASYTLQFAKGTGSDETSTLALIRSGQPNLRTLTSLDYDQRHKINLSFDYVFGQGKEYVDNNGPITRRVVGDKTKEIKWLEGAGLSLQLSVGSGFPYTRSSVAYSTIVSQGSRSVEGAINGSRMPWVVDCNLNIWKDFYITLNKKETDVRKTRMGAFRVYLAFLNLFNIKKTQSVYSYTGSPVDDGFLTASEFQNYIAGQENVESFTNYYTLMMEGLNAYGSPMRVQLGVAFNF